MWVEIITIKKNFMSKIGLFSSDAVEIIGVYFMQSYSDLFVTDWLRFLDVLYCLKTNKVWQKRFLVLLQSLLQL